MAMHLIVENTDPKERAAIVKKLTGPFRTMGAKVSAEDLIAPAWWHGEEEAFESVEGLMAMLPKRG